MENFDLKGKYKFDKDTIVSDPTVVIIEIRYDYINMKAIVIVIASGANYSISRQMDPLPFADPLTVEEIKSALQLQLAGKKEKP